jgi:hypothetical protein
MKTLLGTWLVAATVSALLLGSPWTPTPAHEANATAPSAPLSVSPAAASASGPIPDARDLEQDRMRADRFLARLKTDHRYLDGVTVVFGDTPKGEQAVAYYTQARIVVNPVHAASVEDILAHEVWHVIDWRDNGRLDWGESLPPRNASAYLKR